MIVLKVHCLPHPPLPQLRNSHFIIYKVIRLRKSDPARETTQLSAANKETELQIDIQLTSEKSVEGPEELQQILRKAMAGLEKTKQTPNKQGEQEKKRKGKKC